MKKAILVVGALGGLLSSAVLVLLLVAPRVFATGSLSIPNTIASQPAGDLQASVLDANWTAIANYVNAREITRDILGNRPAASTAGRYYFATDDNGGTLYVDTGSAWTQLAPGVTASGAGSPGSRGLKWATATATNTKFNGTADLVVLRNPSTGTLVAMAATTTATNDILATSPAANARDASSTFSVSSWVHFYYIWNGSALATLSSTCTPTTTTGACSTDGGPVLPTGYTHWAYIGPVRLATAGTLNATWINGSYAAIEPFSARNAAAGTGAQQSINIDDRVPPNHLGVNLTLFSNRNDLQTDLRVASNGRVGLGSPAAGSAVGSWAATALVPIDGQTLYFIANASATAGVQVLGYKVPNGGD